MTHPDPQTRPPGRPPYPLARPFPRPGRGLRLAYRELDLALNGDDAQRDAVGDPGLLPRPWDPGSIDLPQLREELWDWLEAVVDWINTEHVWNPVHLIPACWPAHPHLVHEIAVLADQRHKAGQAIHSDALEEWHRYALPAFFDRRRTRMHTACDSRHQDWPSRPGHTRFQDSHKHRDEHYGRDVDHLRQLHSAHDNTTQIPRLQLIDGHQVNTETGEAW